MEISPFFGIEHVGIGLDRYVILDDGSASSDCIDLEHPVPAFQHSPSIAWSGQARERSPPCSAFALGTGKPEPENCAAGISFSRQLSWQQLMGISYLTPPKVADDGLAPLGLAVYREVQYRHEQIALGVATTFNLENDAVETVRKSTYDYRAAAPDFVLTGPDSMMEDVVSSPNHMSHSVRVYVNNVEPHERLAYDLSPGQQAVATKGHQPSPSPATSISFTRHQRSPSPNALAGSALVVDSDEDRVTPDVDVPGLMQSFRDRRTDKRRKSKYIAKRAKLRLKH